MQEMSLSELYSKSWALQWKAAKNVNVSESWKYMKEMLQIDAEILKRTLPFSVIGALVLILTGLI